MTKSNSFVVVSMVSIVAVVALAVLLFPSMNFDGNVAGQAISYPYLTQEKVSVVESNTLTATEIQAEYDYMEEPMLELVDGDIYTTVPEVKEDLVLANAIQAEYDYMEEPTLELVDGDIYTTIPAYVDDVPYEPILPGEPITSIGTYEPTPEPTPTTSGVEPVNGGVDYGSAESPRPEGDTATPGTYACLDSDGDDIATVGTTRGPDASGVVRSYTDSCYDTRHVVEGTCVGGLINEEVIRCRRGRCSGGACH